MKTLRQLLKKGIGMAFGIMVFGFVLAILNPQTVQGATPMVDVANKDIYARGTIIRIEQGSDPYRTRIKMSSGQYLKINNMEDLDLSEYTIYGGYPNSNSSSKHVINMTGGKVKCIYGGSNKSTNLMAETSMEISGGIVGNVYGGNNIGSGTIFKTSIRVSGTAKVTENVYGGNNSCNGTVQNTNVTISDTAMVGNVYGGSYSGRVNNTNVTVSSTAMINRNVYGGNFSGTATNRNGMVTVEGVTTSDFDNLLQKTTDGWTVTGSPTIPQDTTITIAENESLTIPQGSTLTNNGTLIVMGTMNNLGTLKGTGNTRCAWHVAATSYPTNIGVVFENGKYFSDEDITVRAEIANGYNFLGWYQSSTEEPGYTGDVLSKNLEYTFTASQNTELVAVYEPLEMVSITVYGESSYTINGFEHIAQSIGTYSVGTNVTVAVSDTKDFAYWANDYGKILSRNASYTFTITDSITLRAVYNKKLESKSTVIFESTYGQVMSRTQLGFDDEIILPEGPARYGYTFTGWSMTVEDIKNGIKENTAVIRVVPIYELINQSYTITITEGEGSGNYNLNDVVTATANTPQEGMKFSHWTDENGNILSYNTNYHFYAIKDVTIIANYIAEITDVEVKGTAQIVNIYKDTEKSKIIFVSMLTVPEGCQIQMAGIIGTDNEAVGTSGDGFNKNTAAYVRGNAWSGNAYRFTWTKNVSENQTWYVRAYLVYKDTNENLVTVYGDMMSAELNN